MKMRWQIGSVLFPVLLASGITGGPVEAAPLSRTTVDRLNEKRYIGAGDRAYVIGATDGGFPVMGWHIKNEMGGVWAHPIKLLDGYRFALNGSWLPKAERFTSKPGYVRLDFPATGGFEVSRIEFAPDGLPVVLVGLEIRGSAQGSSEIEVTFEARSELLASYPWDWSMPQSAEQFNQPDQRSFDSVNNFLLFQEQGKPWFALAGGSGRGAEFIGANVNVPNDPLHPGKGLTGQLKWRLNLSGHRSTVLWIGIAGSHVAKAEAEQALRQALAGPEHFLAEKVRSRDRLLAQTKVYLPDRGLQAAFDWAKLNMADLRRDVTNAQIRDVDEGKVYPGPIGTFPTLEGIGAGVPDYPWYFGTDGAYTAYPLVVSGQWDTAMVHLRTIRAVSELINGGTGKVVHEVMTDGSVYFGTNAQPGNTNETAQFASAVELIWRWSGDNGFRDEMYEFVKRGLTYITSKVGLDEDEDGFPSGRGMVERDGMGSEKLDVTAYTWRALGSLERMAASKGDWPTRDWAQEKAKTIANDFDEAWWMPAEGLYADSLCNGDEPQQEEPNVCREGVSQLQQRHWINATPMEVNLAPANRAMTALTRLESPIFSGELGLFHTGQGGGPAGVGELKIWTLPNSVMAIAEANYGRATEALKYMTAISSQLDLEMPGALPEIAPSPEYDPFAPFVDRAMFMQAWSAYGVQWPVIDRFLGIRPNAPEASLEVVPAIPPDWAGLVVQNLQIGNRRLNVATVRVGKWLSTVVQAPAGWESTIGQTVPAGTAVELVLLNGRPVEYELTNTTRGREIRVSAGHRRNQLLMVKVK
jgi:glycogen debranching enzyme